MASGGDQSDPTGASTDGPSAAPGVEARRATDAAGSAEARRAADAASWALFRRDAQAGLAAIYDSHAPLVYGLSLRMLRNPSDAEDLTQEIFLILARRAGYDPARGSLAAFLATLTRSRAIDRLRREGRQRRLVEKVESSAPPPEKDRFSPLERTTHMQSAAHVSRALAELPERQRRVLELAYFCGLSQSEIASELDEPLGTVKSSTRIGLSRLRELLEPVLG